MQYLLKGKGASKLPPPKTRVFEVKLLEAVEAVDTAITRIQQDTPRHVLLFLMVAVVALIWPARPHTMMSCLTSNVWMADEV